jgi:hypothetical protein
MDRSEQLTELRTTDFLTGWSDYLMNNTSCRTEWLLKIKAVYCYERSESDYIVMRHHSAGN